MTGKRPSSLNKITVPKQETKMGDYFTVSGTFQDGDLLVNKEGLKLVKQANEEAASPATDTQITLGDLETIKVIGKGSGGVVQLVRHKWTHEIFALKVMQMNLQEHARKQIVQELKINQATQCKYVVVCHHAFYQNGAISILLEYMDGGSLADIVKQVGQVPEPYLSVISKQVLQGLHYLHCDRHIIHRDIKPSNLLLNSKGEAKITDFGVSAILEHSMGQKDTFIGTYTYMSPERISGSSYTYDSDIWSVGLTLLECALGRFPYQRWRSFYELLEAIVEQPPPVPRPDQFTPEFCSFISGCVQKKPGDRMTIPQLLEHPFIKKYEDLEIGLAELLPPPTTPVGPKAPAGA
eukprot:TRINITY_DN8005_c0_g3_i1.p1 TRINITY_DN8005_c0_g3~~TRINITY_DN8005_c0_g3_i1.p1  ORF type:complete len:351 (+),score=54.17 TRINITY_DN8005_c0_g3_i1:240-1292(+)